MASIIRTQLSTCTTCKLYKYDRHPNKPPLQSTPIPNYPCSYFISTFSHWRKKYTWVASTNSLNLLTFFPCNQNQQSINPSTAPRMIVSDNERSLLCPTVLNYLRSLGIELYHTPTQKSEVNGQVERFHSTFMEMMLKRWISHL